MKARYIIVLVVFVAVCVLILVYRPWFDPETGHVTITSSTEREKLRRTIQRAIDVQERDGGSSTVTTVTGADGKEKKVTVTVTESDDPPTSRRRRDRDPAWYEKRAIEIYGRRDE